MELKLERAIESCPLLKKSSFVSESGVECCLYTPDCDLEKRFIMWAHAKQTSDSGERIMEEKRGREIANALVVIAELLLQSYASDQKEDATSRSKLKSLQCGALMLISSMKAAHLVHIHKISNKSRLHGMFILLSTSLSGLIWVFFGMLFSGVFKINGDEMMLHWVGILESIACLPSIASLLLIITSASIIGGNAKNLDYRIKFIEFLDTRLSQVNKKSSEFLDSYSRGEMTDLVHTIKEKVHQYLNLTRAVRLLGRTLIVNFIISFTGAAMQLTVSYDYLYNNHAILLYRRGIFRIMNIQGYVDSLMNLLSFILALIISFCSIYIRIIQIKYESLSNQSTRRKLKSAAIAESLRNFMCTCGLLLIFFGKLALSSHDTFHFLTHSKAIAMLVRAAGAVCVATSLLFSLFSKNDQISRNVVQEQTFAKTTNIDRDNHECPENGSAKNIKNQLYSRGTAVKKARKENKQLLDCIVTSPVERGNDVYNLNIGHQSRSC